MVIDFQAHLFPEEYINELKRRDGAVILEEPDPYSGMTYFYDKKLRCRINTAIFQGRDIERRLEHMDRLGIDIHVLTIPAPGADRFDRDDAVAIARVANDAIAAICRKHPSRFVGFFTLPTSSVSASLDELERSVHELGLKGFGSFANLNGQALDREELFPIYERLAKYKLPVYIHPTAPLATEATGIDIMPTLIFGWAFDSTVAMTRLVYGRVLERFPEIKFRRRRRRRRAGVFRPAREKYLLGTHRGDPATVRAQREPARLFSAILRRYGGPSGLDIEMCFGFFWPGAARARNQLSVRSGRGLRAHQK